MARYVRKLGKVDEQAFQKGISIYIYFSFVHFLRGVTRTCDTRNYKSWEFLFTKNTTQHEFICNVHQHELDLVVMHVHIHVI